jgi:HK97 family phage major capsid protein
MPTFNSNTDRTDAGSLIPEDVTREIIQGVPQQSAVMTLARRLPNMSRKQQRMPVLSALPTAYFVTGDTGLKQTSQMAWANKYLNAEELAVIVPIPEVVLDDLDYDMWAEIRPRIVEAIGVAVDAAIMFGTNAPADWPDDLLTGATAAGNTVANGSVGEDLYDAILGEGGVFGLVEEDGFMVTGSAAAMAMKAKLRGLRDANGQPIFMQSMQQAGSYMLDGQPIVFPMNGAFDPATALLIAGDWNQLVYSIRQDINYKLLSEAVITDNSSPPQIIFNLPQQDMVALRVTFRLAWQLPNPINRLQQVEANRYPFGVLTPAA